jgi:glucosyl-3-phosphoglycerate synthase
LASEFTDPENRPVFENIIKALRGAHFLSNIILGLDAATQRYVVFLQEIIADAGLPNVLIQWSEATRGAVLHGTTHQNQGHIEAHSIPIH